MSSVDLGLSAEELAKDVQKGIFRRWLDLNFRNRSTPSLDAAPSGISAMESFRHQLVVRPSLVGGDGLFSAIPFARGSFVLELYGVLAPRGFCHPPQALPYLFGLNARFQVDPSHPAAGPFGLAGKINHGCDGNLIALKTSYSQLGFSSREAAELRQPHICESGMRTASASKIPMTPCSNTASNYCREEDDIIFFVAARDIAAGEELLFDYNRACAAPPAHSPACPLSSQREGMGSAFANRADESDAQILDEGSEGSDALRSAKRRRPSAGRRRTSTAAFHAADAQRPNSGSASRDEDGGALCPRGAAAGRRLSAPSRSRISSDP